METKAGMQLEIPFESFNVYKYENFTCVSAVYPNEIFCFKAEYQRKCREWKQESTRLSGDHTYKAMKGLGVYEGDKWVILPHLHSSDFCHIVM